MAVLDIWTDTFAWQGAVYGAGTIVIFKDDFIEKFRWKGKPITKRGIFRDIWGNNLYQFEQYCPELFVNGESLNYALCFSFTEFELQEAIEKLDICPVKVQQTSACEPPFAEEKLSTDYTGSAYFFKYDNGWFGNGTKIYLKDSFINDYYQKTGKRITKKVSFFFQRMEENKRVFYVRICDDMKSQDVKDDYEHLIKISESEFYEALECITEPYAIKYSIKDQPCILLFVIIFIALSALACCIFVDASPIIVVLVYVLYKAIRLFSYQ